MAFNEQFSITPSSDPSAIILTDTSSGSDPNLTERTITLFKADGTLFGTFNWPLATNPITIKPLNIDYALNVVVQANSSNPLGSPSTYTFNIPYSFAGYAKQLFYQTTQKLISNPALRRSQTFISNKFLLKLLIVSAEDAISYAQDLNSAQTCLNLAKQMIDNQAYYFA